MIIEEAIKHAEEVAEENQRVVDTGVVYDDVTIDMLYCDDTEVIEEHLANYQMCADEHRQLAEWLKELKRLREQTRWIPVRERLPKVGIDVLICDMEGTIYLSHRSSFGSFIDEWGSKVKDIRAWMPLPEPYKAESEGMCNG